MNDRSILILSNAKVRRRRRAGGRRCWCHDPAWRVVPPTVLRDAERGEVGVLVFVMSPIADGVGVNGGGFSALFDTRGRLLFGVTGGGIASLSASS